MLSILITIAPLFLIILAGVILRLTKIANDDWVSILNKFGLYGGFVPLVIYTLANTNRSEIFNLPMIGVNVGILLGVMLLALFITKIFTVKTDLANNYITGIFFGNVAYLGFPFITSLYPAAGGLSSALIAIYLVVFLIFGVAILERQSLNKKKFSKVILKALLHPLLLAVIIGSAILLLNIKLPAVLNDTLSILAKSSSPVVLVALGIFLAQKIKINADFWHALVISVIKLAILPALFFVVAYFAGFQLHWKISILDAGMPLAISMFAFTEVYALRKAVVANTIIISTILSVITLTGLAILVR